jgi:hypothetical protein
MKYSLATLSLLLPSALALTAPTTPNDVDRRTFLDIDLRLGTCVKLDARLDLAANAAGASAAVSAAANACLCVDTSAHLGFFGDVLADAGASVDVYLQANAGVAAQVGGSNAGYLRDRVSSRRPCTVHNLTRPASYSRIPRMLYPSHTLRQLVP